MVFRKQVILLSSLAVALTGLYVIGSVTSPAAQAARHRNVPAFPGFDSSQVSLVEFPGGYTLQRAEDTWLLDRGEGVVPTRPERIDRFFEAVTDLQIRRTVTNSPERYGELGIGADEAQTIRLVDASERVIAEVAIGDDDPTADGQYARIDGSQEVYSVTNELGFYTTREPVYWADLRLFAASPGTEAIQRIVISRGQDEERSVVLAKDIDENGQEAWQLQDATGVEEAAVNRLVRQVLNAEARDRTPRQAGTTLGTPAATVTLWDQEGRTFAVRWYRGPVDPTADTSADDDSTGEPAYTYFAIPSMDGEATAPESVFVFDQSSYDRLAPERQSLLSTTE